MAYWWHGAANRRLPGTTMSTPSASAAGTHVRAERAVWCVFRQRNVLNSIWAGAQRVRAIKTFISPGIAEGFGEVDKKACGDMPLTFSWKNCIVGRAEKKAGGMAGILSNKHM